MRADLQRAVDELERAVELGSVDSSEDLAKARKTSTIEELLPEAPAGGREVLRQAVAIGGLVQKIEEAGLGFARQRRAVELGSVDSKEDLAEARETVRQ